MPAFEGWGREGLKILANFVVIVIKKEAEEIFPQACQSLLAKNFKLGKLGSYVPRALWY
jgi:hypothetical protein